MTNRESHDVEKVSLRRRILKSIAKAGGTLFVLVILLEGLYMTSFFAIYLFTTYAPIQSIFERSGATSWLTDFYLSHFIDWSVAVTQEAATPQERVFNPFRLNIYEHRKIFWFIGFFLFFSGAVPIYLAKLRRTGPRIGGVYRFVRHPQYIGFAIVGLPFLVIWPRSIVLVTYVTMLFAYYLLARREETLCLEKFGDGYRTYLQQTRSMFIPYDWLVFQPLQRWFSRIASRTAIRLPLLAMAYALLLTGAVWAAYGLKHHSVRILPHILLDDTLAIALQKRDRPMLEELLETATGDGRVARRLEKARDDGLDTFLVYLLPANATGTHFIKDHFPRTRPKEQWTGRPTPAYDVQPGMELVPRDQLRMLLFWGTTATRALTAEELLDRHLEIEPLVMAGLDLRTRTIAGVVELAEPDESDPYHGSRMPLF